MTFRLLRQELTFRILSAALGISSLGANAFAQELGDLFEDPSANWLREESSREESEGEEEEPLETDRDSFTPSTTVVGAGRTLFESSYSFIENRTADNSHSFPEILTRYGLTKNLELRLGWNYEMGGGGSVSGSGDPGEEELLTGSARETRILYGLKAALTEQEGWLPQSAVIVQATTPTSGPATATQFTTGYVFGWQLPNDWKLDSSMRYGDSVEEGDHFNHWAPSVVLKIPLSDQINVHGEYFGIFTQNRATNQAAQYLSPGIHYLVSSNCEVGVRVGWGITPSAAQFFSNVGLGWRF